MRLKYSNSVKMPINRTEVGMELYQIYQFLAFAECGSVTQAAQNANTSQPSLSRAIRKLEKELDVPLFTRTANSIALNEYGKYAVEYARRIVDDIEQFKLSVRDYYQCTHTVTIAADAPAPLWMLPPVFAECYPESAIASQMSDESHIELGLKVGSIQIGVFRKYINDENYFCRKCGEEWLYFSVPPTHHLAQRQSVTFADIDGETMLLMKDIGFWQAVHTEWTPHSKFLIQDEHYNFSTLVNTSSLPSFSSNLTLNHPDFTSDRVNIPIADDAAKTEYYAVCLRSDYERFRKFFAALKS